MKIQKQGYNECILATIAMLADVPLRDVRLVALQEARMTTGKPICRWDRMTRGKLSVYFWPTVDNICEAFRLPKFSQNKIQGFSQTGTTPEPDLSGKGKGSVIYAEEENGHSVAYENGMIYDPTHHKPLTYSEWLEYEKRSGLTVITFKTLKVGD